MFANLQSTGVYIDVNSSRSTAMRTNLDNSRGNYLGVGGWVGGISFTTVLGPIGMGGGYIMYNRHAIYSDVDVLILTTAVGPFWV